MSDPVNMELKQALQSTLLELNKLSDQIKATRDYSEQAELILCLKELVIEQIGPGYHENLNHTAHATR
jgi:hypothetical protein